MIHEEICTYEVCKLAKEKGFPQDPIENDNCQIYCWDNLRKIHSLCISAMWYTGEYNREDMYAAPTQSLLQRWLREEKKVEVYARHFNETNKYPHHFGTIISDDKGEALEIGGKMFDTYELALEDALEYALENLI